MTTPPPPPNPPTRDPEAAIPKGPGVHWVRPEKWIQECRKWILPAGKTLSDIGAPDVVIKAAPEILPAEPGRYVLIGSFNCPWCHRAILTRSLKKLDGVVGLDVVWYRRDPENGWQYNPEEDGCTKNTVTEHKYVPEMYRSAGIDNQRSVPLLWDRKTKKVVNNESADLIIMLNASFNEFITDPKAKALDLYPKALRQEVDEVNEDVYRKLANGAYSAGITGVQEKYDEAYDAFWDCMDRMEKRLSKQRWLVGEQMTLADVRMFPPLFRLDPVYYNRFKLNKAYLTIANADGSYVYPNLRGWLLDFYSHEEVKSASNIRHCKQGYFGRTANGIVPKGPEVDYEAPHTRAQLK